MNDPNAPRGIVLIQQGDALKHFANDKPAVKLVALFFDKLPSIIFAAVVGFLWFRW